jgi:hypothetical protein
MVMLEYLADDISKCMRLGTHMHATMADDDCAVRCRHHNVG